jgi:predicted enzyme involved in methoxymalonyl-ACP biosynthesis
LFPDVRLAGFNQWQLEIAAGAPELADLRPRLVACLLDDSAVLAGVPDAVDPEQVAARCAAFPGELAAWSAAARDVLGGLVVLTTVPLSPLRRHSLISFAGRSRVEAAWSRMNAEICDLAAADRSTVVLSAEGLGHLAGATFADDRMRHVAGHAYAPEFLLAYAGELARVAAADLGRSRRCLVLDLDDTAWGGTVGDDGTAGLRLGGGLQERRGGRDPGNGRTSRDGAAGRLVRRHPDQLGAQAGQPSRHRRGVEHRPGRPGVRR